MKDKNHAKLLLKLARRDPNALQGMVNDKINFDDSVLAICENRQISQLNTDTNLFLMKNP